MQWLSDVPSDIAFGLENLFTSRESLEEELELMKDRMLVLERKSQNLHL